MQTAMEQMSAALLAGARHASTAIEGLPALFDRADLCANHFAKGCAEHFEYARIAWQIATRYNNSQVRRPLRDFSSQCFAASIIISLLNAHMILYCLFLHGNFPTLSFCIRHFTCCVVVLFFASGERPLVDLLATHAYLIVQLYFALTNVELLSWHWMLRSFRLWLGYGAYLTLCDVQDQPTSAYRERLDRLKHDLFSSGPPLCWLMVQAVIMDGWMSLLCTCLAVWNLACLDKWEVIHDNNCVFFPTLWSDVSYSAELFREQLIRSLRVLSTHCERVNSAYQNYLALVEKHDVVHVIAAGCPFAGVYVGVGTASGRWTTANGAPLPRTLLLVDGQDHAKDGEAVRAMLWHTPNGGAWRVGPRIHDLECWALIADRDDIDMPNLVEYLQLARTQQWKVTTTEKWSLRAYTVERFEAATRLASRLAIAWRTFCERWRPIESAEEAPALQGCLVLLRRLGSPEFNGLRGIVDSMPYDRLRVRLLVRHRFKYVRVLASNVCVARLALPAPQLDPSSPPFTPSWLKTSTQQPARHEPGSFGGDQGATQRESDKAEAARAQAALKAQLDEAKAEAAASSARTSATLEEQRRLQERLRAERAERAEQEAATENERAHRLRMEQELAHAQQRTQALEDDLHAQQAALHDILVNQEAVGRQDANAPTAQRETGSPSRTDDEPPAHFLCPIMQDLFHDPVVTADGATYEREAIEQWLRSHNTSPLTNEVLPHRQLTPNVLVRGWIREYKEQHARRADETDVAAAPVAVPAAPERPEQGNTRTRRRHRRGMATLARVAAAAAAGAADGSGEAL